MKNKEIVYVNGVKVVGTKDELKAIIKRRNKMKKMISQQELDIKQMLTNL